MSQPSPFASATQLARLVAKRDISARELLELYLARVKKLNPAINAVVVLDAQQAAYPTLHGEDLRYLPARLGGLAPTPEEAASRDHHDMTRTVDKFNRGKQA